MNGVLGYLWAHIGQTGPGEPPEDGDMNEMTLPFRHIIHNSTLPLGHRGSPQYRIFTSERRRNIQTRDLCMTFQAGSLKAAPWDDINFRF